ncbi:Gfo/Idh/MocA family oxidoreductase [Kitasatospora sp. NPDC004723]|uniref:Gfo/Idh/MocA family protein n=1 Tax=Kitasatospora sp. NPDC004723 TaxID=3154288 RepID=UPI0033A61075
MTNWGFLGAGSIAHSSLAPAVHADPGATLHSVASSSSERARALAPRKAYSSYEALLRDSEVDVVYIALHNSAHCHWTEAALRAGKHVICEKPLGLSATEVDTMIRAAADTGRLLVEAAWNRWHPRTRDLESMIANGAIGTVTGVTARFDGLAPPPGNYRRDPALGGGALLDVGYYAVSAALAAFGWLAPKVVWAKQDRWDIGSADRESSCLLEFPGGGVAEIHCSLNGSHAEEFTVTGATGELGLSAPAFCAATAPAVLTGAGRTSRTYPALDPYRFMVQAVEKAVTGRPGYLVPLAQSRLIASTIDAVRSHCLAGSDQADG